MQTMPRHSLKDRFEAKYTPEPNTGCWLWTAYADRNGYGKMTVETGTQEWAHRVSYRLYKGEIPDGLHLDHTCSTPLCVNPAHLEAVTSAENQRRTFERGRGIRGGVRKTHCKHGHPLSGENLYVYKKDGAGHRICVECKRQALRRWRNNASDC